MITTPTPPRFCPLCHKTMIAVGRNQWVCPTARTEVKRISPEMQTRVRIWLRERVAGAPF